MTTNKKIKMIAASILYSVAAISQSVGASDNKSPHPDIFVEPHYGCSGPIDQCEAYYEKHPEHKPGESEKETKNDNSEEKNSD